MKYINENLVINKDSVLEVLVKILLVAIFMEYNLIYVPGDKL